MKTIVLSLLLAAAWPCSLLATPPVGPIRLPAVEAAPTPAPPTDPITKLTPDLLFVIDSDVPVIVISSPAGIVTTSTEAGPIKIRGVFVDGNGKRETRTYSGKFVVTVEPTANGRCELLVIPQGVTDEKTIKRRRLDVATEVVPVPNPDPNPDPKPKPDPDTPATPTKLWVVIVEETAEAASNRGAMLSDSKLIDRMNQKQHRFRVVDKDVVGPDGKPPQDIARFLDKAKGKPLPQLFLVDEKGHPRYSGDLPKSAAELLALIQKVGG